MGESNVATADQPADPVEDRSAERARAVIDELIAGQRVLARAQAAQARSMLEFGRIRQHLDRDRITAQHPDRATDARWVAGEFAATEIGLAVTTTVPHIEQLMGLTRRLQLEAPDAWDAWLAGDIDHLKAVRINRALRRLTHPGSKQVLNTIIVAVAVCKTAELLGRFLNQFIATIEPEETNERLHRSLADRYVSLRPDLDGVSFLSAAMSALDATAVDQVLNALAGIHDPHDTRTRQQRRADILVDLLLGSTSNGCHATWIPDHDDLGDGLNGDPDEDLNDNVDPRHDTDPVEDPADHRHEPAPTRTDTDSDGDTAAGVGAEEASTDRRDTDADKRQGQGEERDFDLNGDVDLNGDWDLPAAAFRPDPRNQPDPDTTTTPPTAPLCPPADPASTTPPPATPSSPPAPTPTPPDPSRS